MGRPRKSLEDHVRDGTYRRDRHGPLPSERPVAKPAKSAPIPEPAEPGDAGVWGELTRLLAGVFTERDVPMLRELCHWWKQLKRVQEKLREIEPGEPEFNRLLIAAGICGDKVDKIGSKFGLTPADRAKLRSEASGPPVARVPTRPRTKLDASGPPKG